MIISQTLKSYSDIFETGVISAAVDAGKLAIGVDSNQNHLAPGSILTSMLKRVDVAAYNTMKDGLSGDFNVGVQTLGLAEDASKPCSSKTYSAE